MSKHSEWITHTGNKCPVPDDTLVEVQLRSGTKSGPYPALEYYWNQEDELDDIVLYRLVNQTRAGATEYGTQEPSEQPTGHVLNQANTEVAMTQENAPKANDIQIAGTHYKKLGIQVWDFISANNIGFFEGNAIKYLTRWQDKGGVNDLKKAQHYIQKLIEMHSIQ